MLGTQSSIPVESVDIGSGDKALQGTGAVVSRAHSHPSDSGTLLKWILPEMLTLTVL